MDNWIQVPVLIWKQSCLNIYIFLLLVLINIFLSLFHESQLVRERDIDYSLSFSAVDLKTNNSRILCLTFFWVYCVLSMVLNTVTQKTFIPCHALSCLAQGAPQPGGECGGLVSEEPAWGLGEALPWGLSSASATDGSGPPGIVRATSWRLSTVLSKLEGAWEMARP